MRTIMDASIQEAYSQEGGNLPFFVGKQQHGSGWLRTLARFAFPLLKGAAKVASNTAEDVIYENKAILPSLQKNAINAATKLVTPQPSSINRRRRKRRHPYYEKNNPKRQR